jgi:enoyl-CoA hydratase/carnithine racemase
VTTERPADVIADLVDLGGAGLSVTDIEGGVATASGGAGVVRLGVHRGGPIPGGGLDDFDILISPNPAAPGPWVGVPPQRVESLVADLHARVAAQPVAAAVAAQVLRASRKLSFDEALAQESIAYSMLLASGGFRAWRAATPVRGRVDDGRRVSIVQSAGVLEIRLDRPSARNAFDARMRDDLAEALAFAAGHPDVPQIVLTGAGPAFSAGGDLDEFGTAADPGTAHLVRALRSPARLVHELGGQITARLHGACVGAGIEVPAGAARVTARPGAVFRLPEVSMGLIPGAGGTVTIPRRVGRRRACYMAISGAEIDLATALAWGLVDAVEA